MPDTYKDRKLAQMKKVGYKDQYKYNKEHLKHIGLNLNKETDADILAFWESLPNKRKWFIEMCRMCMGKK